mmetsp:Transcript_26345/g.61723  ORF Transcript_26345/g.61723 Transcript_26345/m.61723 type:complete len:525 (+) Transcript_26345:274-1848(+)
MATVSNICSNGTVRCRGSAIKRRRSSETRKSRRTNAGNLSQLLAFLLLSSFYQHQQPSMTVSGLLLLPLPGRFLTSTLLQRRRSPSYNRNTVQVSKQGASEIKEPTNGTRPQTTTPLKAESSIWEGTSTKLVKLPTKTVRKPTSERDMLIAKAAKLRQSIVQQQNELISLERRIECCNPDGEESAVFGDGNTGNRIVISGISYSLSSSISLANNLGSGLLRTFESSTNVFLRKLDRVQKRIGPNNQRWEGRVGAYLFYEFLSGVRIASRLATEPRQIQQLVSDPRTPTLVPHAPAILARLDRLETHVRPIIERVLNDRQHLASIEPYLDEILERFDDIEPHLPWILDNIDALAPYTGLLLKHIDALLLFADADDFALADVEYGAASSSYSLADQLLPYLEYYISKLDVIGPHLVLLRPHVPLLLKHNRIAKVSPHIDKLFARGYGSRLAASANMDVLLFWFGWTLRIPFAPAIFFALPWSPQIVDFLANRLPKKFARRGKSYCRNLECAIDDDYGGAWNKLDKA